MEFAAVANQELTVSLGSSSELKEQIKQATDIVDLVGSHMQLRRQGRNYVALCPWHDDSRPSLQVNAERQSWKCWVCDIGGDVFSFVMQLEGVTFPEALRMLADRAGIAIKPQRRPETSAGDDAAGPDKRTLYRVMAWAETQYHECLCNLPEGEPGREYLRQREISPESIEKFHLGYCPESWDWILRRAENRGPSEKLLEAVGIALRGAGGTGRAYDRYRGRVMFSIRDVQGRPVGLGGRVLPQNAANQPAKYVNSPETILFRKSDQLYGLDVAAPSIRKNRCVLVMEGYTDCIVAHQYGFTHAVAVLGTALNENHLRVLKRFADRVVLMLDGDEAGQRRANEVLDLFVAQQVDLRIVTLPHEKDPCDFLHHRGPEEFAAVLEQNAVDALEHAFRVATRGVDLDHDVHAAAQALERLVGTVAKAPRQRDDTTREARIREEKIIQRLAESFRIEEREIREQIAELRRKARPSIVSPTGVARDDDRSAEPRKPVKLDPCERELLELLLQLPDCLVELHASIGPEQLAAPAARQIYEMCCRLASEGVAPTFERLMLEFEDFQIKGLLVDLDQQGQAKLQRLSNPAHWQKEVVQSFEQREFLKRRPADAAALREGKLDEAEELARLASILRQAKTRHGISEPTEG